MDDEDHRQQIGVVALHIRRAVPREEITMIRSMFLAVSLIAAPVAAFAMPAVGDIVGTNPTDAAAALQKAGCNLKGFEAEGGMIEAKCYDENNKMHEVYINPKTGAIAKISGKD